MLMYAAILGLVQMLMAASFTALKYGIPWAFSNRDKTVPALEGMGGRVVRGFHNFRETFAIFATAVLVAGAMNVHGQWTTLGAELYFGGRLLYVPVYMAGIIYVRTLLWLTSIVGIVMLILAVL